MPGSVLHKRYAKEYNTIPITLSITPAVLIHGALKIYWVPIPHLFCGIHFLPFRWLGSSPFQMRKWLWWASSQAAPIHPSFTAHQARSLCTAFLLAIPSTWKSFPRWSHNCRLQFLQAWNQETPSPRGLPQPQIPENPLFDVQPGLSSIFSLAHGPLC